MSPFAAFVSMLAEIDDPRRAEGKVYRLPHVMLFAILAIVSGANSYRTIHSFIDVHLTRLRKTFDLKWRKAPAYTTIRGIIRQLDAASVEAAFRRHAAALNASIAGQRFVAIDGKTLRHSFDNFVDRRAAHILTAFVVDTYLVLAHLECDDKSNEIPAVQTLLGALGLSDAVVTVDAMHCQKKPYVDGPGSCKPYFPTAVAPRLSEVSLVRSPLATGLLQVLRRNRATPARHLGFLQSCCFRGWRAGCPATAGTGPTAPSMFAPRQPTVAVECADRQAGGIGERPAALLARPR